MLIIIIVNDYGYLNARRRLGKVTIAVMPFSAIAAGVIVQHFLNTTATHIVRKTLVQDLAIEAIRINNTQIGIISYT